MTSTYCAIPTRWLPPTADPTNIAIGIDVLVATTEHKRNVDIVPSQAGDGPSLMPIVFRFLRIRFGHNVDGLDVMWESDAYLFSTDRAVDGRCGGHYGHIDR